MTAGAELRGADRLASTLDSAARDLADLSTAHDEIGRDLATIGYSTAPRITGFLAAHVGYTTGPGKTSLTDDAPYAAAVHKRDPWLARAIEDHHDIAIAAVSDGIRDAIAQVQGA